MVASGSLQAVCTVATTISFAGASAAPADNAAADVEGTSTEGAVR